MKTILSYGDINFPDSEAPAFSQMKLTDGTEPAYGYFSKWRIGKSLFYVGFVYISIIALSSQD